MNPSSEPEPKDPPKVQALISGLGEESEALASALSAEGVDAAVCSDIGDLERRMNSIIGELVIVGGYPDLETAWGTLALLADREEPALFLSPTRTQSCIEQALAAGAADVLPPPHSPAAVAFRVRVVERRDVPIGLKSGGRSELRAGSLSLDLKTGLVHHDGTLIELSSREFELLANLVGAGGVVSRGMLIAEIWGAEAGDGAAVLGTTVHRLRRKLQQVSDSMPPIRTIRGIGYLLDVGVG
jgi:DNA-binding response OmpR family regulator